MWGEMAVKNGGQRTAKVKTPGHGGKWTRACIDQNWTPLGLTDSTHPESTDQLRDPERGALIND